MRIKPIKVKDRNGHDYVTMCHFCKAEGVQARAMWHLTGACKQACDHHKPQLQAIIDGQPSEKDYSEADHQTWLRL